MNMLTGRFTTPDLLWSAFPAQTPYQYAYNSPLTYRDPSGLAPEKEKEREELQRMITWEDFFNSILQHQAFVEAIQSGEYFAGRTSNEALDPSYNGYGSRTAAMNWAINGYATKTFLGISLKFKKGILSGVDYYFITHIPTFKGVLDVHTTIYNNGISKGETSETVMNAFVSGINDILAANPRFFDHLWGRDISVKIMHSSLIKYEGDPALGLHKTIPNGSEITLAGDILTGNKIEFYFDRKSRCTNCLVNRANESRWQNYAYIGHEFAHAVHWAIAGNDFNTYSHDIKEHFAVLAENILRGFHNHLPRYNPHTFSLNWFNKLFYPATWNMWNNYLKRGY